MPWYGGVSLAHALLGMPGGTGDRLEIADGNAVLFRVRDPPGKPDGVAVY